METYRVCFIVLALKIGQLCGQNPGLNIVQLTHPFTRSEGPHWDVEKQLLFFVNIPAQKLLCLNPSTNEVTQTYLKYGKVGVAVPVAGKNNTFLAGSGTDLVEVEWDWTTNNPNPKTKVLSTVDTDRNYTRFNDGKVDPAGRFWAGTMGENGTKEIDHIASLYRFSADGTPTRILSPVSVSNGLCWSHDNKTFYYIDSPTLEIAAFDFDLPTGDISNKRVIFRLQRIYPNEVPDGMTIDDNGNLWVAIHDGGRVIQVDPKSGKVLKTITMPVTKVTSVAFGGPNLDILYVTSANEGLTDNDLKKQPAAGSVFAVHGLKTIGAQMLAANILG